MKFLSRKFLVLIATAILDILIASGQIPVEAKELLLKLITGTAGLYIIVEGLIDLIRQKKDL